MFKIPVLILSVMLICSGCTFLAAREAADVCDRSNVYCGDGSEEGERDFKREMEDAGLRNDYKNTVKVVNQATKKITNMAPSKEPTADENKPSNACEEGKKLICSTNKGCYCD